VFLKVGGTAAQRKRLFSGIQLPPIRRRGMIMPALLWVVFWSSMMASAACFGELPKPTAPKDSEAAGGD
jgi:hypothetical protein